MIRTANDTIRADERFEARVMDRTLALETARRKVKEALEVLDDSNYQGGFGYDEHGVRDESDHMVIEGLRAVAVEMGVE